MILFLFALQVADSAASHRYVMRGIDAEVRFKPHTALDLYRKAVIANPFAAQPRAYYGHLYADIHGPSSATLPEFAFAARRLSGCIAASRARDWARMQALLQDRSLRECSAYLLLSQHPDAPPALVSRAFALLANTAVTTQMYEAGVASLRKAGDSLGIVDALRRGINNAVRPRDRLHVMYALADVWLQRGNARAAAEVAREAVAFTKADNRPGTVFWHMAESGRLESPAKNDSLNGEMAELACRNRGYIECVSVLGNRGAQALDRGEVAAAARSFGAAEKYLAFIESDYQRAYILIRLGRSTARLGNASAAVAVLKRALPHAIASRQNHLVADVHHNIAHAYETLGNYKQARAAARRFVAAGESLATNSLRIISLHDAGVIYWDSGERAAAQRYFNQMVQLVDAQQHDFQWAGEFFERIGDYPEARRYYQRSLLEIGDTARKTAGVARMLLAMGAVDSAAVWAGIHDAVSMSAEEVLLMPEIQAARGDLAGAIAGSLRWAHTQENRRNDRGASHAYLQAANLLGRASRFHESKRAAQSAYQHARVAKLQPQAAQALSIVATADHRMGHIDSALITFASALRLARAAGYPTSLSETYTALGRALASAGLRDSALVAFDSAIAVRRRVSERFEDRFDQARFDEQDREPFREGLRIVLASRDVELIYTWIRRWKGDEVNTRAAGAVRRRQSELDKTEALIEYAVLDSVVAVIVLTRENAHVRHISQSRAQLSALVTRLRAPTRLYFGRLDLDRAKFDTIASRKLYSVIIQPLANDLREKSRWLIAPDEALNFVPFDALQDTGGNYVIDHVETTYVRPNGKRRSVTLSSGSSIAVIATDAPASDTEVARVSGNWSRSRSYSGMTERALIRQLQSRDVVHLATHAVANATDPLSSYIQLSAGEGDDGLLHVSEIERIRVSAQLVVLSSCETQYGRFFYGSGVMSLASSMLDAGAAAVVATHWPVGEAAADFAAAFHHRLQRGVRISTALREAKLAVRRSTATADPIYWAPFVLIQ